MVFFLIIAAIFTRDMMSFAKKKLKGNLVFFWLLPILIGLYKLCMSYRDFGRQGDNRSRCDDLKFWCKIKNIELFWSFFGNHTLFNIAFKTNFPAMLKKSKTSELSGIVIFYSNLNIRLTCFSSSTLKTFFILELEVLHTHDNVRHIS